MTNKSIDSYRLCPQCGGSDVGICDSRPVMGNGSDPIIRRRRFCVCGHKWSTYEITAAAYAAICDVAKVMQHQFPRLGRGAKADP